ncbi:hypothetical protein BWI96_09060 [Siphonobacter sp. SORGH_AS_0500]|uniref:tRNA1(Val) (adenine(37)-N6)-methyltransferase n=1 Tax=Siphonobacter sp. SORGH_AS_0500 TaxID=1864824 RepID=UPI000CAF64E9|nr:methyltransferase [Siphonobacter sp. SORGH_AS_0500]PKK37017.1 hypothetical protein BWI96_09060 [Siphonobacter sp. SORGH_AS_0500]
MARNSFFTFKQFTIHQDQTSMKVCTDACVLGAWTKVTNTHSILDIGTGTGLLPLMLAQRIHEAEYRIDAVEIDANSAEQARQNIALSPFASQITVIESAIQTLEVDRKYELIISNPPFFQNSLRSPKEGRNRAAHDERLSFAELAQAVHRHLLPSGRFTVLLPVFETELLSKELAPLNFYLQEQLVLKNSPAKAPFRLVSTFSKSQNRKEIPTETLCIRNEADEYTPEFVNLLKDYYLIF